MDDLISREAAIKAVSEYGSVWMEYTYGMTKDEIAERALKSAKAAMIRIIKELPSAQPTFDARDTQYNIPIGTDLISRAAALDCFHDWIDKHGNVYCADESEEYQRIEALPSVQPEIVRCKDCKYYEADVTANPWGVCCHKDWIINDIGHDVDEDGWCYRAERRTK